MRAQRSTACAVALCFALCLACGLRETVAQTDGTGNSGGSSPPRSSGISAKNVGVNGVISGGSSSPPTSGISASTASVMGEKSSDQSPTPPKSSGISASTSSVTGKKPCPKDPPADRACIQEPDYYFCISDELSRRDVVTKKSGFSTVKPDGSVVCNTQRAEWGGGFGLGQRCKVGEPNFLGNAPMLHGTDESGRDISPRIGDSGCKQFYCQC